MGRVECSSVVESGGRMKCAMVVAGGGRREKRKGVEESEEERI